MTQKFKVDWVELVKEGVGEKGPWKKFKMSLTDEEGVQTTDVVTFLEVQAGQTIEGSIVPNEKYHTKEFKKALEKPEFMKKPNMDRVMEKKAGMISEAQDVKAQNIRAAQDRSAWMWAKTNASTLIANSVGMMEDLDSLDRISQAVEELATKIYNSEPTTPFN